MYIHYGKSKARQKICILLNYTLLSFHTPVFPFLIILFKMHLIFIKYLEQNIFTNFAKIG